MTSHDGTWVLDVENTLNIYLPQNVEITGRRRNSYSQRITREAAQGYVAALALIERGL